jgi:transposase
MAYTALQIKRRFVADKIIVGIDPAKSKHQASVIDAQGIQAGKSFSFKHSNEGFSITLFNKVKDLGLDMTTNNTVFAVESSCTFWQALASFLIRRGFTVLLVSPLTTHHSRPIINHDFSKTDPKDALIIACSAKDGYYDPLKAYSQQCLALHRLGITYHKIRKNLTQNKARLRSQIDLVFPEFCSVLNPSIETARFILKNYFLPRHFITMDIEKLAADIKRISRHNYNESHLQELKRLAQDSIGVPREKEYEFGVKMSISAWIDQIECLEKQIQEVLALMIAEAKKTPYFHLLTSLKGISDILASFFIAETRELGDFDHYKKLEKYAGLNLRLAQSGNYLGKRRISHIGNKRLAWAIYKMTEETARYVPEVRIKFLKRQLKERSYRKNIIAASSTLLKIIVAMVKYNQAYTPNQEAVKIAEALDEEFQNKYGKRKINKAA